MGVAKSVTGGFIQKARMHCLLYGFVLCVESSGGTGEVAEKEAATSQIVPESRRLEPRNTLSWELHGCSFAFGPVAVDISRACLFCLFAW